MLVALYSYLVVSIDNLFLFLSSKNLYVACNCDVVQMVAELGMSHRGDMKTQNMTRGYFFFFFFFLFNTINYLKYIRKFRIEVCNNPASFN